MDGISLTTRLRRQRRQESLEWFNTVVRVVVFFVVSLWMFMVKRQRDKLQIGYSSSNVNRSSILHRYVYESVNANMQSEETSSGHGRKRKRDPMADGFSNAVTKLGESLEKMANKLNKGIEREEELDKKRSSITSEISKMRSFTQSQKFKVISMIRGDTERVNMFWDLQEVDREAFVKWVLEE